MKETVAKKSDKWRPMEKGNLIKGFDMRYWCKRILMVCKWDTFSQIPRDRMGPRDKKNRTETKRSQKFQIEFKSNVKVYLYLLIKPSRKSHASLFMRRCRMTQLEARSCMQNTNHLHASVIALMFGFPGIQIYDLEVRDEGSGQPRDNDRFSWSSVVYYLGLKPGRTKGESHTARPWDHHCRMRFESTQKQKKGQGITFATPAGVMYPGLCDISRVLSDTGSPYTSPKTAFHPVGPSTDLQRWATRRNFVPTTWYSSTSHPARRPTMHGRAPSCSRLPSFIVHSAILASFKASLGSVSVVTRIVSPETIRHD